MSSLDYLSSSFQLGTLYLAVQKTSHSEPSCTSFALNAILELKGSATGSVHTNRNIDEACIFASDSRVYLVRKLVKGRGILRMSIEGGFSFESEFSFETSISE
ncbi:uncharacterized protein N7469_004234 [Penicillium citrinum]|uniref:Uncharacterized protein n=1 Tax=Penicillium citrinum TaxID=5077 RepID=A0A9W9P426_PENCI|nr:uncharacterized protein N7469_004234 [Penicillium citrinum]KAJ5235066.1 hypothetical protein N7469_004234 [Penicillium citrinum]